MKIETPQKPPQPWRYIDWLGGQEEFDRIFAEYPPELKADYQDTVMYSEFISQYHIKVFWGTLDEFMKVYPTWQKQIESTVG